MPTITATPFPDRGQILVQTTWGDVSSATCVQVRRVITSTGASTPLRAYVWPCSEFGEYQHLSGGYASFWDTEAPLDEPFTYQVTAIGANGIPIGFSDSYPNGTGGLSMPGTTPGMTSTPDNAALDITGDIDIRADLTLMDWTPGSVSVLVAKWTETGNQRSFLFYLDTAGGLNFVWSTDGTATLSGLSTAPVPRTTGRCAVRVTLDVDNGAGGRTITFYTANTINGPWTQLGAVIIQGGTTSIFSGSAILEVGTHGVGTTAPLNGIAHSVEVRNGINGTLAANPQFFQQLAGTTSFTDSPGRVWTVTPQHHIVNNSAATSFATGSIILGSNGSFWIRDPVRPCNDREVLLCFDTADAACAAGDGIFFAEMAAETYASNSYINLPTNARRPIATSRTRRDANTTLTLVTRTFADRDALLALNEPGSPLQFVGPPEYGIPDRYMTIQNVDVSRGLSDHRYQVRIVTMPYDTVDRPVGPTQGTCGARFQDLCDIYPTWAAAQASGLAWSTLVEGTAADLGQETWGDVNSDFADWNAVLASGTWQDVLEGP